MVTFTILLILGVAATAGGSFWISAAGLTVFAILAGLLTAFGVACLGGCIAILADRLSPTSKRLNR